MLLSALGPPPIAGRRSFALYSVRFGAHSSFAVPSVVVGPLRLAS